MADFQVGDIVARKSYDADIHFRVVAIDQMRRQADLRGVDTRLCADAPLNDLISIDYEVRGRMEQREEEQTSSSVKDLKEERDLGDTRFQLPGRVLHMDGDAQYLKKCMHLYRQLNIPVFGMYIPETEMPQKVTQILALVRPDILVMTGHDAYLKNKGNRASIQAYRHSSYFQKAVQKARTYERNLDDLIIFSGACQSHFEAIIEAGANYASSPGRVNIHALDPVYVVEKACFTPIHKIIAVDKVLQYSYSGVSGIGGIDSHGTFRMGTPLPVNST